MLGIPNGVLAAPNIAIFGVAFIPIWMGFGFYTLLYSAGLNSIDRAVFEAAKIDGASAWGTFRNVTVEMLRPTFAFVITMSVIWNAQIFDQVYVLTRGGPGTLTYSMVFYIYSSAFNLVSLGETYVMSVILLVIIMTLAYISIRYLGFGRPSWMKS
jgi:ABC-type sugar transport system permease subunit